jgi:hypothetical protein
MKRAILLASCLVAVGCSGKSGESNMTGKKEHGMLNCPSAVDGARTELARTADGVELTVTARDPDSAKEIVTLARSHAAMQEPDPDKPQHGGQHGGPGEIGYCPIVHHGNTLVTFDEVPGGARIQVVAGSPAEVAALQEETAERVAALREEQR